MVANGQTSAGPWANAYCMRKASRACVVIASALVSTMAMIILSGPAHAAEQTAAINTGGIDGQVFLGTSIPRTIKHKTFKDNLICGTANRSLPVIRANGEALLDAVVFIENAPSSKPFPASAQKVTVNQDGCTFLPYLSVLALGGELEIINSDPVLHNIHAFEQIGAMERTVFSVSQPMRGDITRHNVDDGRSLRLTCDAHNFMLGFVFIADNPHYDIVDEDGGFRITGLPAGTYTVSVWHGVLGVISKTVTVPAGSLVSQNFSY